MPGPIIVFFSGRREYTSSAFHRFTAWHALAFSSQRAHRVTSEYTARELVMRAPNTHKSRELAQKDTAREGVSFPAARIRMHGPISLAPVGVFRSGCSCRWGRKAIVWARNRCFISCFFWPWPPPPYAREYKYFRTGSPCRLIFFIEIITCWDLCYISGLFDY